MIVKEPGKRLPENSMAYWEAANKVGIPAEDLYEMIQFGLVVGFLCRDGKLYVSKGILPHLLSLHADYLNCWDGKRTPAVPVRFGKRAKQLIRNS